MYRHTRRMSSKSRAASFFISETLFEKRRIVSTPKVGICRNLQYHVGIGELNIGSIKVSPSIQCDYSPTPRNSSIKDTYDMNESCFPDPQLKLMEEIHNKHGVRIKAKSTKPINKSILLSKLETGIVNNQHKIRTTVGKRENGLSISSTFADTPWPSR